MTFKERLQVEHPENIEKTSLVGCMACPSTYGYESEKESHKSCYSKGGCGCEYCWNREIPVDDFKAGDKVKLREGLVVGEKYDGITFLEVMYFEG